MVLARPHTILNHDWPKLLFVSILHARVYSLTCLASALDVNIMQSMSISHTRRLDIVLWKINVFVFFIWKFNSKCHWKIIWYFMCTVFLLNRINSTKTKCSPVVLLKTVFWKDFRKFFAFLQNSNCIKEEKTYQL